MNIVEKVLQHKRAENGGNNTLWKLWLVGERAGLSAQFTSAFVKVERVITASETDLNKAAKALMEAMEALMYAQLVQSRAINPVDSARHELYCTRANNVINAVKSGGIVRPGMINGGGDFTIAGVTGGNSNITAFDSVSTASAADVCPFGLVSETEVRKPVELPDVEPLVVVAEPKELPIVPPKPAAYLSLKDKKMMNYVYHELSVEMTESTNTVRSVGADVKRFTDGNKNLEMLVENFIDSPETTLALDSNSKFTIEESKDLLSVSFDGGESLVIGEDEYGPIDGLTRIINRVNDYREAEDDIDDLVRVVSQFANELDNQLQEFTRAYEHTPTSRKMAIFGRMVRSYLNDAIAAAWYGVTNNTLPANFVSDSELNAVLKEPLVDIATFYENVFIKMYVNDLGNVCEETFITNVALTILKALRSCVLSVSAVVEKETDKVLSITASIEAYNYNLILDCNIATKASQGQLSTIVGMMAQTIETVYRVVDRKNRSANVYLVAGGVYAKLIGSSDESSLTYFAVV